MDEVFKLFLTDYLQLRERQKEFFRTRDRQILMECKRRESELDMRARIHLGEAGLNFSKGRMDDPRQGYLFDETK